MSDDYFGSPKDVIGSAMTEAERVYRLAHGGYDAPSWVTSAQKAAEWFDQAVRETKQREDLLTRLRLDSNLTTLKLAQQIKDVERTANMFAEKFLIQERLAKHYGMGATEQTGRQIMNPAEAFYESYTSDKRKKTDKSEIDKEPTVTEAPRVSRAPIVQKIEIAPGYGLLRFLGHFCSKKFRERVLEALHAESIAEYQEALKRKDKAGAISARYRMYVSMVRTVFGGAIDWAFGRFSLKIGSGE
ncbi:hypothetical protein ACEN8I_15045 [Polaromonas sp. CT11-55]|uniref:hypothetical protein n=1 Tax=Polaromonas sp. CT11-55 TaxID=3243045 RepID=UPI0039A5A6B5